MQGKKLLSQYTKLVDRLKTQTDALAEALDHGNGSAEKHAKYMRDKVVPAMDKLREIGRRDRSAHAARALAAADVSGDAVREVGIGDRDRGRESRREGAGPFRLRGTRSRLPDPRSPISDPEELDLRNTRPWIEAGGFLSRPAISSCLRGSRVD